MKGLRVIGWVAIVPLLLAGLWGLALIDFVYSIPVAKRLDESKTDAIVVLTGGSLRISYGFELLDKEFADRLFISGVGEETSLLSLMDKHGASRKVRDDALCGPVVTLDYKANSTRANAVQTAQWIRAEAIHSIRLVTANYHMRRSVLEFKRAMPDLQIIEDPVFPSDFRLEQWWSDRVSRDLILSEFHKYLIVILWPSVIT